ncbi:penicillin binding protein PBP4B [Flavobacterium sp. UGB4466]|uniref:penicillin binding protein PBP4B n=1 Tax=Flavobacterium sp. UGB4466 TaxID=2730889 RepID=UPI00192B9D02|nr:penicillin binding protein PBP4B [Flavobacterium sp. UGB4466]
MKSENSSYPLEWIEKIDRQIIFSINNGLPGTVFTAIKNEERIFQKSYGNQRIYNEKELMPNPQPMKVDTIFDMASLTKIFSTTFSYMKLIDDRILSIEDKVNKYLPEFTGGDKDQITIKQVLHHNSGLPSSFHFYDPDYDPDFYSQSRERTIELLPLVPLLNKPGTVTLYSDIGFALLGIIIEKVTGMRQDEFVKKQIYQPLGLKNTGYILDSTGLVQDRFEATERCGNTRDGMVSFPNIRTKTIQGEVHDEFAYYSMGQVSGHAGLFSTADDLSVLCQLILNGGKYGAFELCSQQTVDLFLNTLNIDKTYALGFQVPTDLCHLIYGLLLPQAGHAFGHTGWVGNCFVIDFHHNSIVIILTNKKHTPVIPTAYRDRFEGDLLPVAGYGGTIQLFYGGLVSETVKN